MAHTWGEDDDEALLRHHAEGLTMAAAAQAIGASKGQVQVAAQRLGLSWDRAPQVRAAAEARRADAKARRATLKLDLLDDLERLRGQLFSEAMVFNFGGKDNTYAEATLPEPPTADKLKLVQAMNTTLGSIEKLERMDADAEVSADIGLLDQVFQAITAAADMEDLI